MIEAKVKSLDEDLDVDAIFTGLPCSSLRGYLFTLDDWTYNLLVGIYSSSVKGFEYQQTAIFGKSKDQTNWIASRKLDKLIAYNDKETSPTQPS